MNVSLHEALAPYAIHEGTPAPGSTALLVIDMQEFFSDIARPIVANVGSWWPRRGWRMHRSSSPSRSPRPGRRRRGAGGLVGPRPGHGRHAGVAGAHRTGAGRRRRDHRQAALQRFFGTNLDNILRDAGVTDLVICGVMTNCCCETTARDAFMRDYRVWVVADACAAENADLHESSLWGSDMPAR